MRRPAFLAKPDARVLGALLCGVGLALMTRPALIASAAGAELLASGFWCWARAAEDPLAHVARWGWLRRPAAALWLAAGLEAAGRVAGMPPGTAAMLATIEAIAVVWAGLELMAALPLARPYSDLPGPFLEVRPWLPVMLPAAGFVVLWRQAPHWIEVGAVRDAAGVLMLVTAMLGALRAFARRSWTASLRWMVVTDCALAGILLAGRTVPRDSALLLWIGVAWGHAFLLAGELRGAIPRRGRLNARLWKLAIWVALASLAWPILVSGPPATFRLGNLYVPFASIPVALVAWMGARRMVPAPERRSMIRRAAPPVLSPIAATVVLAVGPFGLLLAWWAGFEPSWRVSLPALAPAVLGGAAAVAARRMPDFAAWEAIERAGDHLPALAGSAYRIVVALERRFAALIVRLGRATSAPLLGLHTGDPQEYLLFLMGVAVLALLVPLLQ